MTTARSTGATAPRITDTSNLIAREEVISCITELFLATDRKDWSGVEQCFAPQVLFDMSSVGAGPATVVRPSDIAAGWRRGLDPIEHVHHQAGNFVVQVTGERADAFCYGIAYHFRARNDGRNTRVFVGSYDFALVRETGSSGLPWRIASMRFSLKFVDGNAALEQPE